MVTQTIEALKKRNEKHTKEKEEKDNSK